MRELGGKMFFVAGRFCSIKFHSFLHLQFEYYSKAFFYFGPEWRVFKSYFDLIPMIQYNKTQSKSKAHNKKCAPMINKKKISVAIANLNKLENGLNRNNHKGNDILQQS